MLPGSVLLCLRFCSLFQPVDANRGLNNLFRDVPAGLAGVVCPGLAMLCACLLPLLRLLGDGGMPCCGGVARSVASLVGLPGPREVRWVTRCWGDW